MPQRNPQDPKLKNKRIRDHAKVLRFLMDTDNLTKNATGRLESPQKLVVFFAGYIAMRRIWEVKTNGGRISTGDHQLDKHKDCIEEKKRKRATIASSAANDCIICRIDKEVAHAVGHETSTLFLVAKFKYWGRKFLHLCEN